MSVCPYPFNIFNEPKDNNCITIALTCSDTNLCFFFLKRLIFKSIKFHDQKRLAIWNQNLESVAILHNLKTFIFILLNFSSPFFLNIFHRNIPLDLGFSTIINLLSCFKF